MKIMVIGASGMVGGYIYKQLKAKSHQILGTFNQFTSPDLVNLDFTNKPEVEKIFASFRPQIVMLPAAYADVEGCEKNPQLCNQINITGVRNIVDACKKYNSVLVYFSTDYVFDGLDGPYKEDDQTNPINVYGQAKLEMEEYIKANLPKYLIVRTANVFGWEQIPKNFVLKLINNLKKGNTANIMDDQYGSPTYAGNLSEAIIYLVEKSVHGLYHISGSQVMNRFEFARLVAEVFNLNKNLIKPIKTSQINQVAKRPMKSGLIIDKVQKILPFKLLDSKEGLTRMKMEGTNKLV